MVERYGGKALEEVELRMHELLVADEQEALQMWGQIRDVVKAISTTRPRTLS
jgi:hypothetical protein